MLSSGYVIILILKNEGDKMKFTKRENSRELTKSIKSQIDSLFIGAVINETSLYEYARTKELVGYNKGYTTNQLAVMQKHMDVVRCEYPNIYTSFRSELLLQIQGRQLSSIFTICDKYIRCFSSFRKFDYIEVNNSFRNFSSRLIA
jgi:hypothetical protein